MLLSTYNILAVTVSKKVIIFKEGFAFLCLSFWKRALISSLSEHNFAHFVNDSKRTHTPDSQHGTVTYNLAFSSVPLSISVVKRSLSRLFVLSVFPADCYAHFRYTLPPLVTIIWTCSSQYFSWLVLVRQMC